jgi:hypothetical protein
MAKRTKVQVSHDRQLLKTFGLDPAQMTKAQIKRGGKLLAIISRDHCKPSRAADERRLAALEAWHKLADDVRRRKFIG